MFIAGRRTVPEYVGTEWLPIEIKLRNAVLCLHLTLHLLRGRITAERAVMLLSVTGRHLCNVVVGTLFPHVPSVPGDVLGVHVFPILPFVGLRDYLLRGCVFQDFLPAEITNFHRFLRGFLRHGILLRVSHHNMWRITFDTNQVFGVDLIGELCHK